MAIKTDNGDEESCSKGNIKALNYVIEVSDEVSMEVGHEHTYSVSEALIRTIGQTNYHTILNALCQLSDEVLRAKALAALFSQTTVRSESSQTDSSKLNFSSPSSRNRVDCDIKQETEEPVKYTRKKRKSKAPPPRGHGSPAAR